MRFFKPTLLVVVAGLTLSAFAGLSPTSKSLTAFYAKLDATIKKKDAVAYKKLMTDSSTTDYLSINPKGKKDTLDHELKSYDQVMGMVDKFTVVSTHVDKVVETPTGAVVTLSQVMEVSMKPMGGDKKAHTFKQTGTATDTWVKVGGAWKRKTSKSNNETAYFDGKPIPAH